MNTSYACALEFIQQHIRQTDSNLEAQHGSYRLSSNYQPIFSLAHQEVVGYEALVRAHDRLGQSIPANTLFGQKKDDFDSVFLDRLCRYLHLHNFMQHDNQQEWIFLNVSPKVIVDGKRYGDFFQSLLDLTGLDPSRIVIEIVEDEIADEASLAEAAEYYRSMGCLIAIDDFGKGFSNFNRIWKLKPEIVKLDQSLIQQAVSDHNGRRILHGLISLVHESGSLVLIEGVEDERHALMAIESGADFVQGYYFARPSATLLNNSSSEKFQRLCGLYRERNQDENLRSNSLYDEYKQTLLAGAASLSAGSSINEVCQGLVQQSNVKRCYLLDHDGHVVEQTERHALLQPVNNARFSPLNRHKGMVWSQWREFLKAWSSDRELFVGEPHLSLRDATLSQIISTPVEIDGKRYLFSCELAIYSEFMAIHKR